MQSKHKNASLVDILSPPLKRAETKEVVSLTANVCEQQGNCPLCGRGGHYGIPLVFVLHYPDRSIDTVCYRCGARALRQHDLKIPLTETELYKKMEERMYLKGSKNGN